MKNEGTAFSRKERERDRVCVPERESMDFHLTISFFLFCRG